MPVTHTRPDLAARLGEIQTQIARPTVNTLLMANKLLRRSPRDKRYKDIFQIPYLLVKLLMWYLVMPLLQVPNNFPHFKVQLYLQLPLNFNRT